MTKQEKKNREKESVREAIRGYVVNSTKLWTNSPNGNWQILVHECITCMEYSVLDTCSNCLKILSNEQADSRL